MANHEQDLKQEKPVNIWLDRDQIKSRLQEEEIVEIDDFLTNAVPNEPQPEVRKEPTPYHSDSRDVIIVQNEIQPVPPGTQPLLSFELEKKPLENEPSGTLIEAEASESILKKEKRKRLDEMTKEELIRYLAEIPSLMPRPVCEFNVEGKTLRGAVEKIKGEYVYIKVAFGKKWIKYTMNEIKSIRIVRI